MSLVERALAFIVPSELTVIDGEAGTWESMTTLTGQRSLLKPVGIIADYKL